jgi:hypothetical protein
MRDVPSNSTARYSGNPPRCERSTSRPGALVFLFRLFFDRLALPPPPLPVSNIGRVPPLRLRGLCRRADPDSRLLLPLLAPSSANGSPSLSTESRCGCATATVTARAAVEGGLGSGSGEGRLGGGRLADSGDDENAKRERLARKEDCTSNSSFIFMERGEGVKGMEGMMGCQRSVDQPRNQFLHLVISDPVTWLNQCQSFIWFYPNSNINVTPS